MKALNVPRDTVGNIVYKLKDMWHFDALGLLSSSATGNVQHVEGKIDPVSGHSRRKYCAWEKAKALPTLDFPAG